MASSESKIVLILVFFREHRVVHEEEEVAEPGQVELDQEELVLESVLCKHLMTVEKV